MPEEPRKCGVCLLENIFVDVECLFMEFRRKSTAIA